MNGVERLNLQHSNKQLIITVSGTGISSPTKELEDLAKDMKRVGNSNSLCQGYCTQCPRTPLLRY